MKSVMLRVVGAGVLFMSGAVQAASISGQGTWESTLQGRDLDGNLATFEAYYDTLLNITWLADANYSGTVMNWTAANAWVANLNPYGSGITGWRLPIVNPIDGTAADDLTTAYNGSEDRGYNVSAPGTLYAGSTASEMAHLFYNTLGDKGFITPTSVYPNYTIQSDWGLNNTGPFSNVQSGSYWSASEFSPTTSSAWSFSFNYGFQFEYGKTANISAWAVHDGDVGVAVSSVPVPAAVWLFASGLLGLFCLSRKRLQ